MTSWNRLGVRPSERAYLLPALTDVHGDQVPSVRPGHVLTSDSRHRMRLRPELGLLLTQETEHDRLDGVHPRQEGMQGPQPQPGGRPEQVEELPEARVVFHDSDEPLLRRRRAAGPRLQIERRYRAQERHRVVAALLALVGLFEVELEGLLADDVDSDVRLLVESHDRQPVV